MNAERVVRGPFTAAASSILLVEDAIAQWHTALARAERAAIMLVVSSVQHVSLRAAAQEASRELHQLHERGRAFTAIRRWIVRLSARGGRWDAFALEDTAELHAWGRMREVRRHQHGPGANTLMSPLHIVVVYEPIREGFPLPRMSPNRYNRFLDVLGTFAGVRVTTVRRTLADAASEFRAAYLLLSSSRYPEDALAQCPAADRRRVAARVIGLELIAPRLGPFLELHGLLAGIDEGSLHTWLRADWNGQPGAGALYGLARVGATIGARCYPDPSEHYCRLEGPLHEGGLPHLLVDYLRAHTASVGDAATESDEHTH